MLQSGTKLKSIWWEPDREVTVGDCGVTGMSVVIENGIVWAVADYKDSKVLMYNLAQCSAVELLPQESNKKWKT